MYLLVNILIISECFCQTIGQQKEKIEDYFMPAVKKYQIVYIQQDGSIVSTIKMECEMLKTEIKRVKYSVEYFDGLNRLKRQSGIIG